MLMGYTMGHVGNRCFRQAIDCMWGKLGNYIGKCCRKCISRISMYKGLGSRPVGHLI